MLLKTSSGIVAALHLKTEELVFFDLWLGALSTHQFFIYEMYSIHLINEELDEATHQNSICTTTIYSSPFFLVCWQLFIFTGASQLEMFSLGVITKKGPDFFELFSPLKNGELKSQNFVSKKMLNERFEELDIHHDGIVSKDEAENFVNAHKKEGLVNKGLAWINESFPIDTHVSYLVIALISVALFKAFSLFVYRYGAKLLAISISRDLRQKYFEHLQKLSLGFYQEHNIGALSSRVVNDAYQIADSVNSLIANYLQTPFAFITTFTLCFFISWKLSLLVFFGFPLLIIPIVWIAQRVKRLSKQIQKKQESFASVLVEFLVGIQTIKIFAMEEFSLRKYTDQNEQMAHLEKRKCAL